MKVHSDTDCAAVDAQVVRLEAAIEVKDAALRELLEDGRLSATAHDGIRAALSPDAQGRPAAGKGWLEVREQAARRLEKASVDRHIHWSHSGTWATCKAGTCVDDRAALDALGGRA